MAASKTILILSILFVSCTPKFWNTYNNFMREVDHTNCGERNSKFQNHKLDSTKLNFVPIYMTTSFAPADKNKKNEKIYVFYLPSYNNDIFNHFGLYYLDNYLNKPFDLEEYEEFNGTIYIKTIWPKYSGLRNSELNIQDGHLIDETHHYMLKRKKLVCDNSYLFKNPPEWPRCTFFDAFGNQRCTNLILFDVTRSVLLEDTIN